VIQALLDRGILLTEIEGLSITQIQALTQDESKTPGLLSLERHAALMAGIRRRVRA
jgi:hypothetical protein